MKIYHHLLSLSVFHPFILESSAFVVNTPKALRPSFPLRSPLPGDPAPSSSILKSALVETILDTATPVIIQGNSLRTCNVNDSTDRVKVSMASDGRPLNANIELWHGPDYTATTTKIYIEDGKLRPFNAVVATPKGLNTVAVYNTACMEFPFSASVEGGVEDPSKMLPDTSTPRLVQGGAITSVPFAPSVQSVQVLLKTDGRNLKARLELLQGPNNQKQIIEFYASDGYKRPFFAVIETPGDGNVVRIINQNTVEYPFNAYVEPYMISNVAP